MTEVKSLEAFGIVGFDGGALNGLKIHPDGDTVVYPIGNKVCIQEWVSKKMYFLSGHSNSVATVDISPKGTYIGSGQINHIGFKAAVKLWDYHKKILIASHELHKVRVEALTFTSDERYMITLGGRDDGCVVLWDCVAGCAFATSAATKLTTGNATTLGPLSQRACSFVTGGDSNLRIWNIKSENKSLEVVDVYLGKLRRHVRSIAVSPDDAYGYAGTLSGDIIKFSIKYPSDPGAPVTECKPSFIGCYAKCGPWKKTRKPDSVCYSGGVQALLIMEDGCLIVGGGDGTIDVLDQINWKGEFPKGKILDPNFPYFKALKSVKLNGEITSLELMESPKMRGDKRLLLAGTRTCEIYSINVASFIPMLVVTCHRSAINDIAFPRGMSGVFATGGHGEVRLWCLETCQELLRIQVPNFICSSVLFTHDGKAIVSGWNDGCIRAFTPLTGRLIYCILNTHNKGTSALDITSDGGTLISGGCEGQVRVWDIKPNYQVLKKVLKEHKSPVSAIQVSPNDIEAVSAGTDGSCIIWDLVSLSRRAVLYANTLFMCVCFAPSGCQILTGGSDRRVAYWEAGSGNLARELEATKAGSVNALHVAAHGELFVLGGNDQLVKLWKYQDGIYTHVGTGHAGAVSCCKFSPDANSIVSCCAAGTIIVWKMPEEYKVKPKPQSSSKTSLKAATKEKPLELDLKLTLDEKPQQRASGDRHRIPAAPSKVENIGAMDTHRTSVHSDCPCSAKVNDSARSKPPSTKRSKSKVPDLPTRTTSKEFVNSAGSGDRK